MIRPLSLDKGRFAVYARAMDFFTIITMGLAGGLGVTLANWLADVLIARSRAKRSERGE